MKNLLNSVLLTSFASLIFISCGTARTIVYEPVIIPSHINTNQVEIFNGTDTTPISDNVKGHFEKQLRKILYRDGSIQCGPGIKLQYRFLQYEEGNRFARYFLGGVGNTGEASLMIEVTYFDCEGNELGRVQTEGKISSGIFGGSSNNAVDRAAEEIAHYTRKVILG